MKDYTNQTPVFSESIKITEPTDPAHADNINQAPKQLLQNTLCNRKEIDELKNNSGSINEYDSDETYEIGDYCSYGNLLYKCITPTTGEWSAECWQQTNILEEVAAKVDVSGGDIKDTKSTVEEPTSASDKYPEIQASSGTTKTIFGRLARWVKSLKADKVDASGGDIKDTKVSEFTASTDQWPVPAAGEAPKTLWGKVKKFFEDFKTWSAGVCLLAQLVSNTTTNNANLPASAAAVYQLAQAMLGYAPKSHASTSAATYGKGDASHFGHVELSDGYTSSAGAAADGVAASSKALADAYTALNTKMQKTPNADIKSGTIIEWFNARRGENCDTFLVGTYYPSDAPEQNEGYVEFKRGSDGDRTIAFFYPFADSSSSYHYRRSMYQGVWRGEWKKITY